MAEIAKIKGLSEQNVMQVIAQLYTEINIDGRFACVGTNLWGLKRWYPVEKSDDAVGNAKRPRIINDEDDDLDEDIYAEEEDTYAEEDEYDTFGTKPKRRKKRKRILNSLRMKRSKRILAKQVSKRRTTRKKIWTKIPIEKTMKTI